MAERNKLASIPGQPLPERKGNFLSDLWDEASGAFARYGRRSGKQRDDSIALLNYASAPGTDPLTGAGMKALGLAGLVTHPLAFFPTREEWDERLTNAGNDSRMSRSIGGFLSDLPSLIDPQMAAGGAVLATAPLAAKMLNKADDVADLGKVAAVSDDLVSDYQIPDTWYHGSPADIYGPDGTGKFRLTAGETGVPALWASNDPFTAEGYSRGEIALQYDDAAGRFPLTRSWYSDRDASGGVYGLKSQAKNPLIHDAGGEKWINVKQGKIMREALAAGHDAVVFRNIADNYQNGGPTSDVIAFLDLEAMRPDRK